MKKFKISDGSLHKIEKRLLKVLKKEYTPDGLYVCIDGIHITSWGYNDFSIGMSVRWGKMPDADGKHFQHEAIIELLDGNIHSLIGQFYEKVLNADTDGND